jgi:hemerythrin
MPEPERLEEARSEQESFDAHHQLQAALIDAYEATLLGGVGRQLAADTLGHLVDFTEAHFLEEERFMRTEAYPGFATHQVAHHRLLEQIRTLEAEARLADQATALRDVARLRAWLTDHMMGMDREVFGWASDRIGPIPLPGASRAEPA